MPTPAAVVEAPTSALAAPNPDAFLATTSPSGSELTIPEFHAPEAAAPLADKAAKQGRLGRMLRLGGAVVALAAAAGIVIAAFHTGHSPRDAAASTNTSTVQTTQRTTSTTTNTTTTTTIPTTTTVAIPPAPQGSADGAANALINSWARGDQTSALQVAVPAAVSTLFANQFHSGMAIDRGCSTVSPATCAFGPPGGASPADPLYRLTVTQVPFGWYVSAVVVLTGG